VEEEEWVIKKTHQSTLGIKSSSTNIVFAVTIGKKNEDEEKEKVQILPSYFPRQE
jgi:hypothetical protein